MELTSWPFIGLLIIATVGAAALAAVTWDFGGWRHVRRVATIVLAQILVLATVGALLNKDQGFFASWSELFGGESAEHLDTVTVKATVSASPGSQHAAVVAAAESAHRKSPDKGVLVSFTIAGARTGYSLPARMYLPAEYFDTAQPDRVFPVAMLLRGYPGSLDLWARTIEIHTMLDRLIRAGDIPPMIALMPEQNPAYPTDSECVNAVGGAQADTFVSEDVPDAMMASFRVSRSRAGWGLLGYSTGGFCSANLGIRHADRFGSAAALSANLRPIVDDSTGDLYRTDAAARRANTPMITVSDPGRQPLNFFVFASGGDPRAMKDLREFQTKVAKPDTLVVATLHEGGHNFEVWKRGFPVAFMWFGEKSRG